MTPERAPPGEPAAARSETGVLAVLGRIAFMSTILLLLLVSIWPAFGGHYFYSHHVSHFAAFYIATFATAAGLKRVRPTRLWLSFMVGAVAIEVSRVLIPGHASAGYLDWVADSGGSLAAIAPMYLQDFRRSFTRSNSN